MKIIVPMLLGFILIWYMYQNTSQEERTKIIENITNANPLWVFISILIGIASHLIRAIRWNLLLKPIGYSPSVANNFFAVMTGYLANLGIPRSGEVLRATVLATYEKVPFEKGFGTIVSERVVDLMVLLVIILFTLGLQTDIILSYLQDYGINLALSLGLLVFGIFGLAIFLWLIKKAKSGILLKLKRFLDGLWDGVTSILKMRKKGLFLFYTLLIWVGYVAMFWAIKFTISETHSIGFSALLVCFVAGAFAMMVSNGGLGFYPYAVSSALAIFGITSSSGDAFGWIMWIAQTLMVVLLGAISFILLPLLNRNR